MNEVNEQRIPSNPGRATGRAAAGFSLVEALIGSTILVISILGFAASTLGSHEQCGRIEERGIALQALGRFVERIRADPDWAGLYARLRPLSCESADDATRSRLGIDTSLATQTAATYYPDFDVPASLGTVTFLVQVPVETLAGVAALREDEVAPRYGLPHDLNGDGVIDGNARDADYRALPIVVRLRWQRVGMPTSEVILATWLRGDR